jgi:predicted lipoprotein
MKRFVIPLLLLVGVAGVFWRYPPIRIVKLADAQAARQEQTFDAAAFAGKFWDEQLTRELENAADAKEVAAAIDQDPKTVREKYGRSVGVSRSYFLFLRGEGVVVSADKRRVGLALKKGQDPDVALLVGPVFGNAVRDATGLLNASDFPNSQHFNEISQELNKLVEARVLPALMKDATAGERVQFVGCAEVRSEPGDLRPLKVVPLSISMAAEAAP